MNLSLVRLFENRILVLATRHKKEEAILPHLQPALGIIPIVPENLDTDAFGTFSGEKARTSDPLTTAREKCLYAMKQCHAELGIASEGSFGPHPAYPFVAADDELLIFIDLKNNLEIVVREISTDTNFNSSIITSETELLQFAKRSQFPSHALILKGEFQDEIILHKGLTDDRSLRDAYDSLTEKCSRITAETDMRAMFNPSRMKIIAKAAQKLTEKILTPCTRCEAPGFGVVRTEAGLPCGWCGNPTSSTKSFVYQCKSCSFEQHHEYPHGKYAADPMYCNVCNP